MEFGLLVSLTGKREMLAGMAALSDMEPTYCARRPREVGESDSLAARGFRFLEKGLGGLELDELGPIIINRTNRCANADVLKYAWSRWGE